MKKQSLSEEGFSYHLDEKNLVYSGEKIKATNKRVLERLEEASDENDWEVATYDEEDGFIVTNAFTWIIKMFKEEYGKDLI